jgi:IS30 family transposase
MGTRYKQLSAEERVTIYHWHANGKSARFIGEALGRQPSTITRELKRNSQKTKQWAGGYEAVRANALAQRRRRWDGRFKLARQPDLRAFVRQGLAMGLSPEQIAGGLARAKGSTVISHESIYRYAYHCSDQKDYWHKLLPQKKHRRGRVGKRGGSPVQHIKHRISLDQRPAFIAKRKQKGHWETDMLLFSRYGQSVLVAQERASRFILLAKPKNRHAPRIQQRLAAWFKTMPHELRRTLTLDNGTEFAHHYKLNNDLTMRTFFCDPHSPWQKGGIENMNRRLRRDLPRKTDLAELSHHALQAIATRHNNSPRKCLGFKTPTEVFSAQPLHFKRESTFPLSRE